MTKAERELIDEKMKGLENLISSNFKDLNKDIVYIKEQTTRTNGRVCELEIAVDNLEKLELTHTIKCPALPRIVTLEKANSDEKSIKGFLKSSLGVAAMIFTAVYTIFKIIELIQA